jgi:hypothetical protein
VLSLEDTFLSRESRVSVGNWLSRWNGMSPGSRDKKRHAASLISYTSQAIAECNAAAANMRLQGEWSAVGVSPAMLAIAAASSKGISLEILSLPAGRGWRYISAYRFGQTIGRYSLGSRPDEGGGRDKLVSLVKLRRRLDMQAFAGPISPTTIVACQASTTSPCPFLT